MSHNHDSDSDDDYSTEEEGPAAKNELGRVVKKTVEGSFRERVDPDGFLPELFFDGLKLDQSGRPILKKLDLSIIPIDATIVNFGMRRTGKSTLTRHLLYYFKDELPRGLVFTDTNKLNRFYEDYFDRDFIINNVDRGVLDRVLKLQELFMGILLDEYGRLDNIPEEELVDVRLLLLLDDVIQDDQELRNNPQLNAVFVNGRHYRLFLILNTQYEKAIPPKMRNNVDIAFMFYHENLDAAEHLWRLFGTNMDRKSFYSLLFRYTEDYCTLVSVRSTISQSIRLIDRLYWFKADATLEDEEFGLGEKFVDTLKTQQYERAAATFTN